MNKFTFDNIISDNIFKGDNEKNHNSKPEDEKQIKLFDVKTFERVLKEKSSIKKFERSLFSNNITAYDLAINCIQQVLYKMYNTPISDYSDIWLPVLMRSTIGNAVHEFIQDNFPFTETEVVVKIDDFKFSGRVDAIINNDVLVEIKTVSFNDYKTIISINSPREKDLLQTLTYKLFLEKYLDKIIETKNNQTDKSDKYNWPKQQNYQFKYIQFIYIAHDLISSEINTINEAITLQKQLKKLLNSKHNKFYFIHVITYDIEQNSQYIQKSEEYLLSKLERILQYYNKGIIEVSSNDEFIDRKACFFCPYKRICSI